MVGREGRVVPLPRKQPIEPRERDRPDFSYGPSQDYYCGPKEQTNGMNMPRRQAIVNIDNYCLLRLIRRVSCLPSRLNFFISIPCLIFSLASAMKIAASIPVSIAS